MDLPNTDSKAYSLKKSEAKIPFLEEESLEAPVSPTFTISSTPSRYNLYNRRSPTPDIGVRGDEDLFLFRQSTPRSSWDDISSFSIRPPKNNVRFLKENYDSNGGVAATTTACCAPISTIRYRTRSIGCRPSIESACVPRERDPVGMPARKPVFENLMRSLRNIQSSKRYAKTPYPESGQSTVLASLREDEEGYFDHSDDGSFVAVGGDGGDSGERFRLERRCNLTTNKCATVLAPSMKDVGRRSGVFNTLGLYWLLGTLAKVPKALFATSRLSVHLLVYGAKFAVYMFLLYMIANLALVVLRVVYVMKIGDEAGTYSYIMRIIAFGTSTLAWFPFYVLSYAFWIIAVALGLEVGPQPTLF